MKCLYPVSPFFHRHHDTYATILIAPSEEDSDNISFHLTVDNLRREEWFTRHGEDLGRNRQTDWFKVRIGFRCRLSAWR